MRHLRKLVVAALIMTAAPSGRAEVLHSSAEAFTVKVSVEVSKTPAEAYRTFVGRIGSWWSPAHTFFGDASNLSIEPRAQGCFCERAPSGREVVHLTVVFTDPGKAIRLKGGLGPLQDQAVSGVMTVEFQSGDDATEVVLTYRVSGYLPDGLQTWAAPVDSVLSEQLLRYQRFLETGAP